jgi:hypothetical protein
MTRPHHSQGPGPWQYPRREISPARTVRRSRTAPPQLLRNLGAVQAYTPPGPSKQFTAAPRLAARLRLSAGEAPQPRLCLVERHNTRLYDLLIHQAARPGRHVRRPRAPAPPACKLVGLGHVGRVQALDGGRCVSDGSRNAGDHLNRPPVRLGQDPPGRPLGHPAQRLTECPPPDDAATPGVDRRAPRARIFRRIQRCQAAAKTYTRRLCWIAHPTRDPALGEAEVLGKVDQIVQKSKCPPVSRRAVCVMPILSSMAKLIKIGQASRLIGKDEVTLRRWDERGVFPTRRDKNGDRIYTERDVVELRQIGAQRKAGRPPKSRGGERRDLDVERSDPAVVGCRFGVDLVPEMLVVRRAVLLSVRRGFLSEPVWARLRRNPSALSAMRCSGAAAMSDRRAAHPGGGTGRIDDD